MATDYLPSSDAELNIWLGTYQGKIGMHGPTCGLTAGEVTDTSTDCTTLSGGINNADTKKQEARAAVAAKDDFVELRTTAPLRKLLRSFENLQIGIR